MSLLRDLERARGQYGVSSRRRKLYDPETGEYWWEAEARQAREDAALDRVKLRDWLGDLEAKAARAELEALPESDRKLAESRELLADRQAQAKAMGVSDRELEPPKGFLMGALDTLDKGRAAVFALGEELGSAITPGGDGFSLDNLEENYEDRKGFGDTGVLRFAEDDGFIERALKATGAFAGDVLTDPLTYLTFGAGGIGRKAVAEGAEAVVKQAAKSTVAGLSDDVLRRAARGAPELLQREAGDRLLGAMDDVARKAAEREVRTQVASRSVSELIEEAASEGALHGAAAEGLANGISEAFVTGGGRNVRRYLSTVLGDERQARLLFDALPEDVSGGLRLFSPIGPRTWREGRKLLDAGDISRSLDRLTLSKPGHGIFSEAMHVVNRARLLATTSAVPNAVIGRMSGKLGASYRRVLADVARDREDVVGAGYSRWKAIREVNDETGLWVGDLTKRVQDEFLSADGVMRKLGDSPEAQRALRTAFHGRQAIKDEATLAAELGVPALTDAHRVGLTAAQHLHAALDEVGGALEQVFPDFAMLNDYIPRVMTDLEREFRRQVQPAKGGKAGGAAYNATARRAQYVAQFGRDDQGQRVLRWMENPHINQVEGRSVFMEDPLELVATYSHAATRVLRRERFLRQLEERGMLVRPAAGAVEGLNTQKVGETAQALGRRIGRAQGSLDRARTPERLEAQLRALGFDGGRLDEALERARKAGRADVRSEPRVRNRRVPNPAAGEPLVEEPVEEVLAEAGVEVVLDADAPAPKSVDPFEVELADDEFLGDELVEPAPAADVLGEDLSELDELDDGFLRGSVEEGAAGPAASADVQLEDMLRETMVRPSVYEHYPIEGLSGASPLAPDGAWVPSPTMDDGARALFEAVLEDLGWTHRTGTYADHFDDEMLVRFAKAQSRGRQADAFGPDAFGRMDAEAWLPPSKEAADRLRSAGYRMGVLADTPADVVGGSKARSGRLEALAEAGDLPGEAVRSGAAFPRGTLTEFRERAEREFREENPHLRFDQRKVKRGTVYHPHELKIIKERAHAYALEAGFDYTAGNQIVSLAVDSDGMADLAGRLRELAEQEAAGRRRFTLEWADELDREVAIRRGELPLDDTVPAARAVPDIEPEFAGSVPDEVVPLPVEDGVPPGPARPAPKPGEMPAGEPVSLFPTATEVLRGRKPQPKRQPATILEQVPDARPWVVRVKGSMVGRYATRDEAMAAGAARAHAAQRQAAMVELDTLREEQIKTLMQDRDLLGQVLDTDFLRQMHDGDPDAVKAYIEDLLEVAGRYWDVTGIEPDQFKTYRPDVDSYRAQFVRRGDLEEVDPVEFGAFSQRLSGMFAAPEVVDAMRQHLRVGRTRSEAEQWMLDQWEPFYSAWKAWATVGRGPGFVARNVLGGMHNGFLVGVQSKHWKAAEKATRQWWLSEKQARRELARALASEAGITTKEATERLPWHDVQERAGAIFAEKVGPELAQHWAEFQRLGLNGSDQLQAMLTSSGFVEDYARGVAGGRRGDLPNAWQRAVDATVNRGVQARWINAGSFWSSNAEQYLRFGTFLRGVEKYGVEDGGLAASLLVKATQFDYDPNNMSMFERNVLKRVIPFYTFARNNLPLQVRAMATEPGRINRIVRALEAAQDALGAEGDLDEDLPAWMREMRGDRLGISVADIPILGMIAGGQSDPLTLSGSGLPLFDLARFTPERFTLNPLELAGSGLDGLLGGEMLSSANPVLKSAIEGATGASTFTGQELKDDTSLLLGPLGKALGFGGMRDGQAYMDAAWANAIRALMPPVGQVERLTAPGDVEKYDRRQGSSLLTFLTGAGFATAEPVQLNGAARGEAARLEDVMRQTVPNYDELGRVVRQLLDAGWEPERIRRLLERRGAEAVAALDAG